MQPPHTNRLAHESSPYLLQHAHNPVDWYPWGAEAFAEARRRDVPIFLSIGYSTCYWCHVMERECFENEAVARQMNEGFVCVKVDREERPDIDDIYMTATILLTQHGGWPMSVFLEPEKLRPFWAGTYLPPEPAMGRASFPQVMNGISEAWREHREAVLGQGEQVAEAVRTELASRPDRVPVGEAHVTAAVQTLLASLDRIEGGFGAAPKFPQPVFLDLLMEARAGGGDDATVAAIDHAVRLTLDRMMIGGMRDQVGGGFHRYSVDASWTVPHFEKMLYDNAQLAATYARAAALYDDDEYRRVVRTTLDYVLREMTQPGGGFGSAQDAEVNGREGLNYLWTEGEVRGVLEPDDAAFAVEVYGLDQPNFRDPHHPDEPARNVLRLSARPDAIAELMGITSEVFHERFDRINNMLYAARARREQPRLDDKVLAGWSGLMIAGLCAGAEALDEERFADAAARAASFVLDHMTGTDGSLLRVWRDGSSKTPAFLDDHAFLAAGLVALHRLRPDRGWDDRAIALIERGEAAFGDGSGGFYDTRAEQDDLFVRARSVRDGAVPTGQSALLNTMIDLFEITGESSWGDRAVALLASMSGAVAENALSASNTTRGLLRLLTSDRVARTHPVFAAPGASGGASVDPAGADPISTPVEVFASEERIVLREGEPASLEIALRIADGYHIVASEPGAEGVRLEPLRVHIVGGTGVRAYADYPAGESYGGSPGIGAILVYTGEVTFEVAVELDGAWSGEPRLAVTYQACNDRACLAARTAVLDLEIARE